MSAEHTLWRQINFGVSRICANGTGMEKGTLLKYSDPDTVAASTAANDIVGGILLTEKIANDGNTQCLVLAGPGDELIATASGSVAMGDPLVTAVPAGGNLLGSGKFVVGLSGSKIVGYSSEAVSAGETFKYTLNIGGGS